MKYFSNELWARLPFPDFRARFFIETYSEKLHMQTPHFQQARLMNLFSCCREALTYIADQRVSEKNTGYLQLAVEEIESCLKLDPVAKDMFAPQEPALKELLKITRSGNVGTSQLARLEVLAELMLARRDEYEDRLLAKLREAVIGTRDMDKKERLLQEIYNLTGLYVTNLLDRGYSPTYLYNRAEMFTRPNNYGARDFVGQFDSVTKKLRSRRAVFRVHFSLNTNKVETLLKLKTEPEFSLSRGVPEEVSGKELDKLRLDFPPKLVATLDVESTDYVRAAWLGKEKLDGFLDFASALEVNPIIAVAAHCVIVWDRENLTHKKSLNLELLTRFMVSEAGTYLASSPTGLQDAFELLDDAGRQSLQRSLRYLRLSRESTSNEQKLLNLWIAFESLFSDTPQSVLLAINDVAPPIYATMALRRRIAYLRDLLGINGMLVPQGVCTDLMVGEREFSRDTAEERVFGLIKNEDAAIALFDSLGEREHLKFVLKATCDVFANNRTIRQRIERSEADVARQVRRIYALRNKMAHTGQYAHIRPQLVTHLVDYLTSCYIAVANAARVRKAGGGVSMAACFQGYKMGVEQVIRLCGDSEEVQRLGDITPVPII